LTPSPLAFGNVPVGGTAVLTVTVKNTGNAPLTGGTNSWVGLTPTEVNAPFSLTAGGTCTATLAVAATCTFPVTFAPTTTGASSKTLSQTYTGATVTPASLNITGTGVYDLTVSPTSLAFGSVTDGITSTKTLTLTAGATAVTGITVGAFPAGYSRPAGAAGGTCTTALAANSTCTIIVQFAPTTVGAYNGTVAITSGFTVAGSPVSLTGTGTTDATISPTPGAFGNVVTGTSKTITETLATGAAPLTGVTATVTGTGFSRPTGTAGGTCGATVAANTTCTIIVQYTATTVGGPFAGSLAVTASEPVTNAPVPLSATVPTPTFTLTPAAATLALKQNLGGTDVITVNPVNGFTGPVTLTVTGMPTGMTASFGNPPTNTLAVFPSATTAISATGYTLTITGTSGALTATTTVKVTVGAEPTFTLKATSPVSVSRSVNFLLGPVNDTVTINKLNGFANAINFTATVTGVPTGGATGNLVLGITSPIAASATTPVSDTLTIKSGNVLGATGAYTVTITGTVPATGNSAQVQVSTTITVNLGL
jgi:hypothetical protein